MTKIELRKQTNGILILKYGSQWVEVSLKECFPWSKPGGHLSLRDKEDNEVCLIEDLNDLHEEAQALIREELKFSQFVLNISSIEKIEEDVELRRYLVQTQQGRRIFQTKLERWPEVLESGEIIIEDLAGDLFRIENLNLLDELSRKELSPYVS